MRGYCRPALFADKGGQVGGIGIGVGQGAQTGDTAADLVVPVGVDVAGGGVEEQGGYWRLGDVIRASGAVVLAVPGRVLAARAGRVAWSRRRCGLGPAVR
jgi:hypothetical protein